MSGDFKWRTVLTSPQSDSYFRGVVEPDPLAIIEGRRHIIKLCLLEPTYIVLLWWRSSTPISSPHSHSILCTFQCILSREGIMSYCFFTEINYMACLDQWIITNRIQGKFWFNLDLFFHALGHCHQKHSRTSLMRSPQLPKLIDIWHPNMCTYS